MAISSYPAKKDGGTYSSTEGIICESQLIRQPHHQACFNGRQYLTSKFQW